MFRQRTAGAGFGLAVLSAATFGTAGSFARSLTDAGWSPAAAVATRISVAAALLAIPGILSMRGRWSAARRHASTVTVYGLLAVAGAQLCFFNALGHLPVGVALMLEYLGTFLVVGWMWLTHGHRPRRLTVAGSLVAVAGLILVLDLVGGADIDVIGVLWGLGAACGLATYFVVSGSDDLDIPPVAVASGGMFIGALAMVGLGAVGLLPMHAGFGLVQFAGHQTSWIVPVAGLSVVAAVIAYVAGIEGARILGPRLASFVGLFEVVFAVLFAWALLGELPTALQLAGGVLIVAGVAMVRVDELRAPAHTAAPTGVTEAVLVPAP